MRRKSIIKLAFCLLAVMLCAGSCKKVQDIRVTSFEIMSLTPRGFKGLDISVLVGVDNPAKTVTVSEIEGQIKHSGKVIGNVAADPFSLTAKSSEKYNLKANVSLAQGAGIKELMMLASPNGLDECTVDVSAKVTYGKTAPMTLKKKDIPLKKLLDKFENESN